MWSRVLVCLLLAVIKKPTIKYQIWLYSKFVTKGLNRVSYKVVCNIDSTLNNMMCYVHTFMYTQLCTQQYDGRGTLL